MGDVTLSISATSKSSARTDVKAGQHTFYLDKPVQQGGTDMGPNPVMYLLGALSGCINIVGFMVAKEMDIEIKSLKINVKGTIDPMVYMGKKKEGRAGFKNIEADLELESNASPDKIEKWKETVEKRCPVSENLFNPTPINITISKK